MRYYYYIISICFLAFLSLLSACEEEKSPSGYLFSLQPRQLSFHSNNYQSADLTFDYRNGLELSFELLADNTDWEIIGLPEWITAQPMSGHGDAVVTLTAQENYSVKSERVALFHVKSSDADFPFQVEVNVSQSKAEPYTEIIDGETLNFSSLESTQTIEIHSNVEWHVESAPSWLTCSPESNESNGELSIKVSDNPNVSERSGTIVIKNDYKAAVSISVTQEGKVFSGISPSRLEFPITASSQTVEVKTNGNWNAQSSASWVHLSPASGLGDATLHISVDASSELDQREAVVTVSVGESVKQISIVQDGVFVETTISQLNMPSEGGTQTIEIHSNVEWHVESAPSWLTCSPENGERNGKLNIMADDNPNTAQRSGTIVIKTNYEKQVVVTMTQEGKMFWGISNYSLFFQRTSSSQTVEVNTNGNWMAQTTASWVHLSPASGSGNSTLSISVDDNPKKTMRETIVQVTVGEIVRQISIVQAAAIIAPDENDNILPKQK